MKRFHHTRLWSILRCPEQTKEGIALYDAVLNEFTEELHLYCREEKELAERTRTLRLACCELTTAQKQYHTGAGKKSILTLDDYPCNFAA